MSKVDAQRDGELSVRRGHPFLPRNDSRHQSSMGLESSDFLPLLNESRSQFDASRSPLPQGHGLTQTPSRPPFASRSFFRLITSLANDRTASPGIQAIPSSSSDESLSFPPFARM